jgi:hypothetical protein
VVPEPGVLQRVQTLGLELAGAGSVVGLQPADLEVEWRERGFSPVFGPHCFPGLDVSDAFTQPHGVFERAIEAQS